MSKRPKIKQADGSLLDLPLDAETIQGKGLDDLALKSDVTDAVDNFKADEFEPAINELRDDIPTKTSQLTNDSNYATTNQLFSKNYNDLNNKPSIPSSTSDLTNDSNFITNAVNNLTNYYLKSETYTKNEVQQLINAINSLKLEVVSSLPTSNISTNTIYLKPLTDTDSNNTYEEYIYINNKWEIIGTTKVDLSDYVKLTDITNGNIIVKKAEQDSNGNVIKDTYATKTEIPTKTSELTNDSNFLTEHQDLSDYAKKTELKTINNQSIVGPGNIAIESGGGVTLPDNITIDEAGINIDGDGSEEIRIAEGGWNSLIDAYSINSNCEDIDIYTNISPGYVTVREGDDSISLYADSALGITKRFNGNNYAYTFPNYSGEVTVKAGGYISNINGIFYGDSPYDHPSILFDDLNGETLLISYTGNRAISMATTEMMIEGSNYHNLKFPDTSSSGSDTGVKYNWELPEKSGTIALLEDLEGLGGGGSSGLKLVATGTVTDAESGEVNLSSSLSSGKLYLVVVNYDDQFFTGLLKLHDQSDIGYCEIGNTFSLYYEMGYCALWYTDGIENIIGSVDVSVYEMISGSSNSAISKSGTVDSFTFYITPGTTNWELDLTGYKSFEIELVRSSENIDGDTEIEIAGVDSAGNENYYYYFYPTPTTTFRLIGELDYGYLRIIDGSSMECATITGLSSLIFDNSSNVLTSGGITFIFKGVNA